MSKRRFRFNDRGYFWSFPWYTLEGVITVIVGPYEKLEHAWFAERNTGHYERARANEPGTEVGRLL